LQQPFKRYYGDLQYFVANKLRNCSEKKHITILGRAIGREEWREAVLTKIYQKLLKAVKQSTKN